MVLPAAIPLLKQYQRLVEVMHNLASTLELEPLLQNIMDVAVDLADASEASILLYDHSRHRLYFQSSTNIDQLPMLREIIVPEESIAGWVALHRQAQIVNNVDQDQRHFDDIDQQVNFQTASMIAVPLVANDKLVGVLEVLNKHSGIFTQTDQEILVALGAQAAVAIENSRLFQQSDLIAEFVHELRTPLTSVLTAAYLLQRTDISEEQHLQMAKTVAHETQRLNELATIFLDLSSLESGRANLRTIRFSLRGMLLECCQMMQIKASDSDIEIVLDAPTDLPEIEADRDKLKQVFLNLLSNAVKYNRPGGNVWVKVYCQDGALQIHVRDTGVGIPPDQISRLFTKFFRARNIEHQIPGTGLGLSIARRIIEMHGGHITVESYLEKGTTFFVTLPIK